MLAGNTWGHAFTTLLSVVDDFSEQTVVSRRTSADTEHHVAHTVRGFGYTETVTSSQPSRRLWVLWRPLLDRAPSFVSHRQQPGQDARVLSEERYPPLLGMHSLRGKYSRETWKLGGRACPGRKGQKVKDTRNRIPQHGRSQMATIPAGRSRGHYTSSRERENHH